MAKQKSKLTQDELFMIVSEFNKKFQVLLEEKGISFLGCIAADLDNGERGTANIMACKAGMFNHISNEIIEEIQRKISDIL